MAMASKRGGIVGNAFQSMHQEILIRQDAEGKQREEAESEKD